MKPSGIEWIGNIPDDWEICRLKRCLTIQNGLDYKSVRDDNGEFPVIGSGGQFDFASNYLYDGESVLFGRKGTVNKPLYVNGKFWTVDTMFYSMIKPNACGKFIFYAATTIPFDFYSTATAVPSMTQRDLINHYVVLPPLSKQRIIADYLDEKCGEIDATIAKQKESIEKLKAYKQSLISETVTKGLDKSAPLKPSGIKWLGEIPQNARIIRLRFLSSIQTGDKDTVNRVENGKYPFYVRSPIVERIDTFSFDGEAILMAGDGVGAGKVFHYVNGKFDYHQRVYNIHNLKGVLGKFLYYYLRENFYKEIEQSNAKSTVDSIRLPMLLDFPIIVYPYDLQKEMVSFLDKKVAEIDAIIIKKQNIIQKLDAYKKSLIFECVTGKQKI